MRAIRSTTIIAIVSALFAGLAVGVAAQSEEAEPVEFEGQWGCEEPITPPGLLENGDVVGISLAVRLPVLNVTDPRLDGVTTRSGNHSVWGSLVVSTITIRIETDEGAWQGGLVKTSLGEEGLRGPAVLVGEGAYEGFTVIMDPQFKQDATSGCWGFRGFIVEGGMPPPPEPPEPASTA